MFFNKYVKKKSSPSEENASNKAFLKKKSVRAII